MLALAVVQIVHTVTKQIHRIWFESPAIGRPLRDDTAGRQERLFPRDCRESVCMSIHFTCAHAHFVSHASCPSPLMHAMSYLYFLRSCCPSAMTLQGSTYAAALHMDLCYQLEGGGVQRLNRRLGMVPIMVKSDRCYLRHLTR